jgi:hypothetical protein
MVMLEEVSDEARKEFEEHRRVAEEHRRAMEEKEFQEFLHVSRKISKTWSRTSSKSFHRLSTTRPR